jgi:hypothetical protein
MSLKAFHIVFITASTALILFFGAWAWMNYFSDHGTIADLLYGIGSIVGLGAIIWYALYFLKKLKQLSYL